MAKPTKTLNDIKLKEILQDNFVESMIKLIERFEAKNNCIVDINYQSSIRLKK